MRKGTRIIFGYLIVAFIILSVAGAAGAEGPDNKTLSPYFLVEGGDATTDHFPLKQTSVNVRINGVIADVTVTQRYINEGQRPINAQYVFPASTRAAVDGMKMTLGNRVITARIKEKEEAAKEFEEAKRAGKSASLLSQHRPNVFSMKVANIMPRDTVDIELHYTELLVPSEGVYEFVYPTVVGPRYSSQTEAGAPADDLWVVNPFLKEGRPPTSKFRIGVDISAGMPVSDVSCTSHKVDVRFADASNAAVTLKESEIDGGNRDFILRYRLSGGKIQAGVMRYEKEGEKFFLLMMQPAERVKTDQVLPREYIFVVDISGSMHGYPLNVSKGLLRNLIGSLQPTDKFNVILFSGGSRLMAPSSVPATAANIRKAVELIDCQQGGGGTELLAAVRNALALPRDEAFSRSVLIVTDGYISAEKEVFDEIRKNLERTNFFAFGIGTSVNRFLIEGIAKAGMGEPFIVTDQAAAPDAARRFCDYVRSPLLRNIRVKFEGFDAYDVEPREIPDLFAERPIVVIGKYHGTAAGRITITGKKGDGDYSRTFALSEDRPLETNRALRYLWARTRIARLSDYADGPIDPEQKREITSLGLTYNLLTKYTSFIAVSDVVRNPAGGAKDVKQPLPLPQGVSNLAVGGQTSQVPEPGLMMMLALAAALLTPLFLLRVFRRRRLVQEIRRRSSR
jgi:Ca-activated chloride channel family protein